MALVKCLSSFSYPTSGGPATIAAGELLDESDPAVTARRAFFSPTAAESLTQTAELADGSVTASKLASDVAPAIAADEALTGTYAGLGGVYPTSAAPTKFEFDVREAITTYPVVTIRPKTANLSAVLDVMPNGSAGGGAPHAAWIDVCDKDVSTAAAGSATKAARLAIDTIGARVGFVNIDGGVGSSGYQFHVIVPTDTAGGTTTAMRFQPAYGGVASADDYTLTSDPYIILALHGGSVITNIRRLKTAATMGFFHLPSINGTPSATPAVVGTGASVPMAYDKAASKLWAHDGTSWKSVTFA